MEASNPQCSSASLQDWSPLAEQGVWDSTRNRICMKHPRNASLCLRSWRIQQTGQFGMGRVVHQSDGPTKMTK